jgi:hypothetical protein
LQHKRAKVVGVERRVGFGRLIEPKGARDMHFEGA